MHAEPIDFIFQLVCFSPMTAIHSEINWIQFNPSSRLPKRPQQTKQNETNREQYNKFLYKKMFVELFQPNSNIGHTNPQYLSTIG